MALEEQKRSVLRLLDVPLGVPLGAEESGASPLSISAVIPIQTDADDPVNHTQLFCCSLFHCVSTRL